MNSNSTLSTDGDWCLPEEEAEVFLSQVRRGERPSVEALVERYPDHEDAVRSECQLLMFAENMISKSRHRTAARGDAPELESVGDYQIIRLIGRGGMGFVYEATQFNLSRPVAVKVLAEGAVSSRRICQRFALEAEAASRLHHPNIVPVFDYGEDDGIKFLVMLYIDGCNLNQIIRQSIGIAQAGGCEIPPECIDAVSTWEKIATLGAQVADGLHHAHMRGMIHRDVKPANLLLDRNGHIFIADFGLAKIRDEDSDLSRTGDTIGTPRYMSPEAMRGLADERSDIFGLGVTLYEMIAHAEAFTGTNAQQILSDRSILQLPPLSELNPDVPKALAAIIMKACAQDPRDRYQDAESLRYDLNQFAHGKMPTDRRRSDASAQAGARQGKSLKHSTLKSVATVVSVLLLAAVFSSLQRNQLQSDSTSKSRITGAPDFVGLGNDRTIDIDVKCGTTSFRDARLQAIHPENQSVRYQIAGGPDANLFAVHPETGEIVFRQFTFSEEPQDKDRDGVYELDLIVTDSSRAELMQFVNAPTDGGLRAFEPVRSLVGDSPWNLELAATLVCVASPDGRTFLHAHNDEQGSYSLYRTQRNDAGKWSQPALLNDDCGLSGDVRGWSTIDGLSFICMRSVSGSLHTPCSLSRLKLQSDGTLIETDKLGQCDIPGNARGLWMYDDSAVMYFVVQGGQLEQWFGVQQPDGSLTSSLIAVGPWHETLSMIDAAGWIEANPKGIDSAPAHLKIHVKSPQN